MPLASNVLVFDNLSSGSIQNIQHLLSKEKFRFVKGDLLKGSDLRDAVKDCDLVFHLAANPEVPVGARDTVIDILQNLLATHNLLEYMRASEDVPELVFTSTSAVYGEASTIPTPEEYGPLFPISLYGASKLACEALISSYRHIFGCSYLVLRLANVVGAKEKRGVIPDFIRKLRENEDTLEILGDGTQTKSYITVEDCVDALIFATEHATNRFRVLNVGTTDYVDVMTIASIIAEEMGLREVKHVTSYSGSDGRGWPGDVRKMLLDTSKIRSLGWAPKYASSKDAIRVAARELIRDDMTNSESGAKYKRPASFPN